MEKDLSSMLSTDPEDSNRLASVHSVSSCEEVISVFLVPRSL